MVPSAFYPSEIACQAAQLKPSGSPYDGSPTHCAMCGRPIQTGTPALPIQLSRTFTNFEWLQPSTHVCGWCEQVSHQHVLRAFQRAVVTPQGCYAIGTDANRSWLWLSPPKPPFVVIINSSTTGAFHYLWKTPVTIDTRLMSVNFDGAVAQVRQSAIAQACGHAKIIRERGEALGYKKIPFSPFVRLARDGFKNTPGGHGHFTALARELARQDRACASALDALSQLRSGELVALASILKAKPVDPEQPLLRSGQDLFATPSAPSAAEGE